MFIDQPTIKTSKATGSFTLPATAGAASTINLITMSSGLLCMQVIVTTVASARNYTIELFDGDPTNNLLVYQATGITVASYVDAAVFFLPSISSGTLKARITNIDANSMTANISLNYIAIP